ncbi:hypothetical protein ONZ45_g17343 [Pleurotus djamor]|nr:hypothetical protein ONZ45_g17343 [Pleurotus djamor]
MPFTRKRTITHSTPSPYKYWASRTPKSPSPLTISSTPPLLFFPLLSLALDLTWSITYLVSTPSQSTLSSESEFVPFKSRRKFNANSLFYLSSSSGLWQLDYQIWLAFPFPFKTLSCHFKFPSLINFLFHHKVVVAVNDDEGVGVVDRG